MCNVSSRHAQWPQPMGIRVHSSGAASIEEVVNVLQQLQNEAFEEEKQQQKQISNKQFQELLNGINFDEPIEETKNYVVNQTTKNLSKE